MNSSQTTTAASAYARVTASGPFRTRETISPRIAAKRADVSIWTIYRLLDAGLIAGYKPSPRKILIFADSLEAHRTAAQDPAFWDTHQLAS